MRERQRLHVGLRHPDFTDTVPRLVALEDRDHPVLNFKETLMAPQPTQDFSSG